jgi:hypothetical protein
MVGMSFCGSAETGSLEKASAIPIVSNVVAMGRPKNGADGFIGVLHRPPSEVTILCQPIEIQIAYDNSDFDTQHDDLRDIFLRHRGSYSDRSLSTGSGSPARWTPRFWQWKKT